MTEEKRALKKVYAVKFGVLCIIHVHVCLFEQSKLMVDIFLLKCNNM